MTGKPTTVLIVAGEASGDLHAAKVVSSLRELAPNITTYGVGGGRMRAAGTELVYHCDDFAVVGLVEVLRHVPALRHSMRRLLELVELRDTRLAVLVDYPGFNLMLAALLRRMGVRVLYYISPQVWAWGEGRVKRIAETVDRMAVVLPFEEEFYRERGVTVEFVGHPLLEEPAIASAVDAPGPAVIQASTVPAGGGTARPVLGLLPGSRTNEIRQHLPAMVEAAMVLLERVPGLEVRLGRAAGVGDELLSACGDPAGRGIEVVPPGGVHDVVRGSTALLISSGTATLEAACLGTPMVVVYRLAWLSYVAGRALVRIPHIGLVNVVAGEKVVPELIQSEATAAGMVREVEPFLTDPELRRRTSERLLEVRRSLGSPGASRKVARMIVEMTGGGE